MLDPWFVPVGFACAILTTVTVCAAPKSSLPWSLRLFVLIMGLASLQMSLVQAGYVLQTPFMAFLTDPIDIAFAPLAYIYLHQLNHQSYPHWKTALHFAPVMIALVAMIPFWLMDGQSQLEYYQVSQHLDDWRWPSDRVTVWIMLFQFLFYSPFILIQYQKRIRQYDNQIPTHRYWLHWLVGTYYSLWLILGILAILQFNVNVLHVVLVGLLTFVASITCVLIRQPMAILGKAPRSQIKESWKANVTHNGLSHLADRLHQYMRVSRCFLDAGLTLKDLSQKMKTPPGKLTKVFNQHLNEGFYDYINRHRVEAAKNMLIDQSRQHYSVTDIMAMAGFSSNSVFYDSFKRIEGKTPAQYRKTKRANKASINVNSLEK